MNDKHTPSYSRSLFSPIGHLRIICSDHAIQAVRFDEIAEPGAVSNNLCDEVAEQLMAYFNGNLKTFDLALRPDGTEFQKRVWHELMGIGFGETLSYLDLAKRLDDEKSIRAAASANGKNPIPIIIPCHRVIGSDGSLTGYAGGLDNKRWLLQHEVALQPELF